MQTAIHDHPAFQLITPWSGIVPAGYTCNFVGQIIDPSFFAFHPPSGTREETTMSTQYPPPGEETFEWIALLESVTEAQSIFTMVELGAGYGRWVVAASCALRMIKPETTLRFVAVEAEPSHYRFMLKHFRDNGIDPEDHVLFEGVVNGSGKPAHFVIGHAENWYGQAIVPEGYSQIGFPDSHTIEVPATRLRDLLEPHDLVDLVDMDIQGAEEEVVLSDIDVITSRVRRISIGTHSESIHNNIGEALAKAGWAKRYAFPPLASVSTEFGEIHFNDGVHYWKNPSLLSV